MPLDPSIILGGHAPAPIQTPSPLELLSTVERVQSLREQTELRRLAGEKARQAAADDAQVRSVFAAAGDDVDAALKQLYAVNPRVAATLAEQVEKGRKEKFAALSNELDYKGKQLTHGLSVLGGMNNPTGYRAGRPMIAAMSPELDKFLPPEYDPETTPDLLTGLSNMGLTEQQKVAAKQEMVKLLAEGKPQEALNKALANTQTPEQWDQVLAGAPAYGVPKDMIALAGSYSPENKARAAAYGVKPEKIDTTDAAGKVVQQFVIPTVGATYAVAPKPVAYQAKDFLLDGKPVSGSFNPDTNTYHYAGQDVTARVRPIPPQGPGPDRELVAIIGPDGKSVLVPRSEAVGKTPASGAGAAKLSPAQQEDIATMLTVQQLAQDATQLGTESKWEGVGPVEGRIGATMLGYGGAKGETLRNKIGNIQATIAKLRGGTSFTPNEQALLETYTPTITDTTQKIQSKLASLADFIKKKRENTLRVAAGDYTLPASAGGATTTPGGGSVKILSITPVP